MEYLSVCIMKEILRTNSIVLVSRVQSILNDAGIKNKLLDAHTSNIEGSISAIQMRVVVSDDDFKQSQRLMSILIDDKNI